MSTTGPPLSVGQRQALAAVRALCGPARAGVGATTLARALGVSKRTACRHLRRLRAAGYVVALEGGHGRCAPVAGVEPPAGAWPRRGRPPRPRPPRARREPPACTVDHAALAAIRAAKAARGETPTGTRTVRVPRVYRCHAPEPPR